MPAKRNMKKGKVASIRPLSPTNSDVSQGSDVPSQLDVTPDVQPDVRPDVKPDVDTDIKPDIQPDVQPLSGVQTSDPVIFDSQSYPACSDEESQPPSKKCRKANLNLTDDNEEDIVDWIKNNELLYNKGLKSYKDTQKKSRLWGLKAKEFGLEAKDLQTWYESMRTRFGRLSVRKSGDGAREITERDQWILTSFNFLSRHIVRIASRQGVSIKAKIVQSQSSTNEEGPEEIASGDEHNEAVEDSAATTSKPAGSASDASATTSKPAKKTKEDSLQKLDDRAEQSKKLQNRIEALLADADAATSSKTLWGQWQTTMMSSIHDDLWDQYLRQSFDITMWYVAESNKIRKKQLQAPMQGPQAYQQPYQPAQQFHQHPVQQFQQPTSQHYQSAPAQQYQQQNTPQHTIHPSAAAVSTQQVCSGGDINWETPGPSHGQVQATQVTPSSIASSGKLSFLRNVSFSGGASPFTGLLVSPTDLVDGVVSNRPTDEI